MWIVTLQTPALLCNPNELIAQEEQSKNKPKSKLAFWLSKPSPEKSNIVNQADKLKQAYNKVWRQLSNDKLELERFFATQSLAGGYYLWKRFQASHKSQDEDKLYQPYLLTDAGSVFVLKATGDITDAQEVIDGWFKRGLSLPDWTIESKLDKKEYEYWKYCPYIRHNGYGEIAVNSLVYKKLKDGDEEVELIEEESA